MERGFYYLEHTNIVVGNTAIVGSYLHYDYSAKEPSLNLSDEYYVERKQKITNDGFYLIGLPDDITFAQQIGVEFRKRLLSALGLPLLTCTILGVPSFKHSLA